MVLIYLKDLYQSRLISTAKRKGFSGFLLKRDESLIREKGPFEWVRKSGRLSNEGAPLVSRDNLKTLPLRRRGSNRRSIILISVENLKI